MKKKASLTLIYALLILIGGIIGHIKAGSAASLIMGIVFSILLLASSIGMMYSSVIAYFSSIIISTILTFFFLYRFMLTQKMMPAGVMAIISVIVLLALIALPDNGSKKTLE